MNTFPFKKAILAGALALGFIASSAPAADKGIRVGDSFPELTSFALEGKLPDALQGKVVLVDFWASWCGPCKDSFPVMEELQARFGKNGLVVLAVNLDEDSGTMNDFLKKHPVTFTVVRDARKKLVTTVNIKSMPSSFVLAPDGKVASVHKGFHGQETRAQYVKEIEQLIAGTLASK
jgi:cytochrome c biogenesis protein CcmG, thiol:disulfide interchange protein DsbE